jgi:hypothetical protein
VDDVLSQIEPLVIVTLPLSLTYTPPPNILDLFLEIDVPAIVALAL